MDENVLFYPCEMPNSQMKEPDVLLEVSQRLPDRKETMQNEEYCNKTPSYNTHQFPTS